MSDEKPGVKHITMTCLADFSVAEDAVSDGCQAEAFVQVLVVEDADLQKKIDARANAKLREALDKAHKEGLHD